MGRGDGGRGGSSATVRDSIIAHNGGSPAGKEPRPVVECLFGGGFVVWQGATLTILNSEIEENVARYGGGIQVTLASTLVVRESKLTRNRCNWDGCAIGLGDLGFLVEMTKGAEALAQVATNPKVQLLDVQIEHECNMGRYSPRGNGDWGQGPARHNPCLQLRQGPRARLSLERILGAPVAAGPNILEFDTPLDIRNLRVATTGCDEIASRAVLGRRRRAVHTP